ncbi:hypothetical protein ACTJIL_09745 [Luteimonas sp. 22616]|uniref:hypothetical protein n=1 Tax=Luteimonas sp. 22616 TaxID=3453951 RepID=UPI003F85DD9F
MSRLLFPAIAAALLACSACGPAEPPVDPARHAAMPATRTPDPAPPAAATAPDPAAGDTPVRYACSDASTISVTWGNDQARIELPDGSLATLPKAQSASKGGGEVFVGDTVSLQRDGDDIELFAGDGPARQCSAQPTTD